MPFLGLVLDASLTQKRQSTDIAPMLLLHAVLPTRKPPQVIANSPYPRVLGGDKAHLNHD